MSHIPSAAMKHAGPHHDAPAWSETPPDAPLDRFRGKAGLGIVGWSLAAIGGTVAVGLIAAIAGRQLRSPPVKAKRKRAKPRKSAQA